MPDSMMKIYSILIGRLKDIHEDKMDIPAETLGGGVGGDGPTRVNKTPADRLFPWQKLNQW